MSTAASSSVRPRPGDGSWAGAAFFTFSDGVIDDLWVLGDLYGLHEQLAGTD